MKNLPLVSSTVELLLLSILPSARFFTAFLITKHTVPQRSRAGTDYCQQEMVINSMRNIYCSNFCQLHLIFSKAHSASEGHIQGQREEVEQRIELKVLQ